MTTPTTPKKKAPRVRAAEPGTEPAPVVVPGGPAAPDPCAPLRRTLEALANQFSHYDAVAAALVTISRRECGAAYSDRLKAIIEGKTVPAGPEGAPA